MFGWRSFEIYPLQVRTAGATPVQVPLTDYTYDLDAMLAAITDRTRLIFVCNPNNPTSTVVDPDEAGPVRRGGALGHPDRARRGLRRVHPRRPAAGQPRSGPRPPNVVVLRTFSKAYGLAGLRIGYAVGDPDIITALGKVYVPFTATSISQAAAIASLDAADELLARTDAVVAERARVTRPFATPATPCRRRRPTSSGCRCPAAPRSTPTPQRTAGSSCGPTARTACVSPLPRRTRTTRSSTSPALGLARTCGRCTPVAAPASRRRRAPRSDRRSRPAAALRA